MQPDRTVPGSALPSQTAGSPSGHGAAPAHRARPEPGSRRSLLSAGGLGAALAATAVLTAPATAYADNRKAATADVTGKDTVAGLLALPSRARTDGELVLVAGYRSPGDGGGMALRWDARSAATHNGGTVLIPDDRPSRGRWLQLHDGVMDFRRFGHFDASRPADDALDAMIRDPSVHRVEAHTDLLFRRRHTITRSRLEFDFGSRTVHTAGMEKNTHDNPFGALLYCRGTRTDTVIAYTLADKVVELTDCFPVPDSSDFEVGQWWCLTGDEVPGGGADERELQKLVQITEILDPTHLRVNYLNGWEMAAGRTLTWTRVRPVAQVHVRNMVFLGAGQDTGAVDDEYSGSHPVAYEYAVDCDVSGIHATGTFWPVIMRRWCTRFRTESCSLKNPPTVMYGGAGYLTQQIYCLYGRVADCTTSNVRHLNDLTASAYCHVINCHGDGDDEGGNPFTTHGQYEHDLLFEGNSGLMDIANSGSQWGISAKRITVRDHVCSWFTANTKITDLTLENVRVIPRPTFDTDGTLVVNADGAQLKGCSARFFAIAQRSSRSSRPTTVTDCVFTPPAGSVLVQTPVSAPVHFVQCVLTGLDGNILRGSGPVTFTDCTLTGAADGSPAPLQVGASELLFRGGTLADTGIVLTATRDQRLSVGGGARLSGSNSERALLTRLAGSGNVTIIWDLDGVRSGTSDGTAHLRISSGTNHYTAIGSHFTGGTLDLRPEAFTSTSTLLHTACTENNVTRHTLPDTTQRIRIEGNLIV